MEGGASEMKGRERMRGGGWEGEWVGQERGEGEGEKGEGRRRGREGRRREGDEEGREGEGISRTFPCTVQHWSADEHS